MTTTGEGGKPRTAKRINACVGRDTDAGAARPAVRCRHGYVIRYRRCPDSNCVAHAFVLACDIPRHVELWRARNEGPKR